jgi:NADPH:quinone reductase-like Zn-dependent oxidoreductase
MKAIIHQHFGIDALEFRDSELPEIGDDQVLVRVRAASVNPVEFYDVYAPPFVRLVSGQLRRPKDPRVGADVAGTVEHVGANVHDLREGDDVFGVATGSWAEFAAAPVARIARKPTSLSFEAAAALPIAALTALQAVRDVGGVQSGQRVLVNGASGGVGTYAVQIAKAWGADVTAVCSTGNVEQARSLGADRVVDYTIEDFTTSDIRHEVMLDVAGSRSFLQCRRVLTSDATVVVVGAKMSASLLGPLPHIAGMKTQSIGRRQRAKFFVAKVTTADLDVLATLVESGTLRSVIDRRFALSDAAEALRYLAQGHARGKVVIDVEHSAV